RPERVQFLTQMRHEQIRAAAAAQIAERDPHIRLRVAYGVVRDVRDQCSFLERAVALIDPEVICPPVVRNEDVDPAVAVEIRADDSQSAAWLRAQTALGRNVLVASPPAVAAAPAIAEQARRSPLKLVGVAVVRPSVAFVADPRRIVIDVSDNDEIEPSV